MAAAKKPVTRLYLVSNKEGGEPVALIRALSVAQARNFFAEKTYNIGYAEQGDIVRAVRAGIDEEEASGDAEG